jgi:integrase
MNSTTLQNFHKHIFDDQYIKDFFTYRDIGTSTQKTYRIRLGKYCQFTVQTPTQLIEEAKKDQIQINWIKERRLTRHLTGFKQYLQKNGKSYNTIKTYMATIKGFYHEFDIETPRIKIKDHAQKERITTKDIVGKEHIKNALKHANIKYRALILLMSSSGMGSAEIRHLTWEHFLYAISEHFKPVGKERFDIPFMIEKLRKKRNLILTWNIRRYKTGHPYTTFTTPEANMAFLDYLEDRHRENKTIRKIDDPLFLSGNTRIKRDAILKYFAYLNDTCKYGICGRSRVFYKSKAT